MWEGLVSSEVSLAFREPFFSHASHGLPSMCLGGHISLLIRTQSDWIGGGGSHLCDLILVPFFNIYLCIYVFGCSES